MPFRHKTEGNPSAVLDSLLFFLSRRTCFVAEDATRYTKSRFCHTNVYQAVIAEIKSAGQTLKMKIQFYKNLISVAFSLFLLPNPYPKKEFVL